MKKLHSSFIAYVPRITRIGTPVAIILTIPLLVSLVGCSGGKTDKKRDEFFTSGSRDADQRATQRMAKEEQLSGSGEGAGEKGKKVTSENPNTNGTNKSVTNKVEGKLALFDRLGGAIGISNIVQDFMPRALQDPRVNWQREATKKGGIFSSKKDAWTETPESVAILKKHLVQFLALATGGPAHYEGKDIQSSHAGMKIANPEFDAVIGDFKASLDKLQVPNKEQKELLAIIESTRPQIVTER
jgi:hemoglobin